jgi:hypothetical protein
MVGEDVDMYVENEHIHSDGTPAGWGI